MAESEREIRRVQIRSLIGESTIVSVFPESTIEELKLKLKESFLPAKDSPNFHLFFKGTKLNLESQIGSHSVGHDDFLVLVPFTKKERTQKHDTISSGCQPTASSQGPNQNTASSFADLAWSTMMKDLSYLSDISKNGGQPDPNAQERDKVMKESSFNQFSSTQRRKRSNCDGHERLLDDVVHSILCSVSENVLDEQNSEKFLQFLESIDCLSDPKSGNCSLKVYLADNDRIMCNEKKKSCLCPSWLKRALKGFALINTFYVVLQMQRKRTTWDHLDGALKQLRNFGLDVDIADLKHLSVLCPEVVRFGDQETAAANVGDFIVIFNPKNELEVEAGNCRTGARKTVLTSTVLMKMKKRENVFRKKLLDAVTSFMGKTMPASRMTTLLSLEDLLKSIEESADAAKGCEAKVTRCCSATSSSHSLHARCQDTNVLSPGEMVDHLRNGFGSQGQIVHIEEIGVRKAVYVEIPNELSENTRSALQRIGVTRLYSHQAESIQASLSGKDVVVATMTSSGKSVCYNVPVLEALTQNLSSCALYLFPTKALAQDQLRALLVMTEGLDISKNMGVYDGDTSQQDRKWLRDGARLLITNPDMLHMSILPYHRQFQRILSNLRFVIIDEAHAYKGAFGCHTALILRRLRRLCCHVYGSDPSFVFSTATSANPREHAMELASLSIMELIQKDGSPCGPKHFILWNPPLCYRTKQNPKTPTTADTSKYGGGEIITRRSSPVLEVSCLFAEMVQHGLRCIAFCKTRKLTELVLCYTREILQETAPDLVGSVCAYRAGYIAEDRRRIENEFFNEKLRGVAATNALELGIDVGHIDATLHLGFPGSIASLWQQAGRSGRRERPALAVYVAFEGPLDQYFMKFPQKLFWSPIESCHVYAHNQQVLEQHLVCAALEHPLSLVHDEKYFGSCLNNAMMSLTNKGYLSSDPSREFSSQMWSYIGHEKNPSRAISIRAVETERYKVIANKRDEVLEEIEESRAFFSFDVIFTHNCFCLFINGFAIVIGPLIFIIQVYEGAAYMHQGKTYLVKVLDLSTKVALCEEANLKYYTKTRDYTDIHVIGGDVAYPPARVSDVQQLKTTAQTNMCKVTTTWFGFYRIWRGSNQIFDKEALSLPQYSYESQAVWIRVPQSIKSEVEIKQFSFRAGLHASCHAFLNVVPLYIMCNSSDLACECANPHETRYFPERILLYDQHPGGIGLSVQVLPLFTVLLAAALELVTTCPCLGVAGCPNCVQNLSCREYNEVLDKNAAIMILQAVIEVEDSYFQRALNSGSESLQIPELEIGNELENPTFSVWDRDGDFLGKKICCKITSPFVAIKTKYWRLRSIANEEEEVEGCSDQGFDEGLAWTEVTTTVDELGRFSTRVNEVLHPSIRNFPLVLREESKKVVDLDGGARAVASLGKVGIDIGKSLECLAKNGFHSYRTSLHFPYKIDVTIVSTMEISSGQDLSSLIHKQFSLQDAGLAEAFLWKRRKKERNNQAGNQDPSDEPQDSGSLSQEKC
ncbi:hypothetical protein NE237_020288 [Protea cynaroides]|uniref:Uncharacterized protein n=1 Tax=Protea cynaroides TaxID=273540 RepID=A0A9Q0K3Q7_9MAGN|nr:hypothetical protein NE237_020288 [Protea cynaroides]